MKLRRLFCFIMSLAIIMCGVPVSQAEKSDILNASFNVQEKNGERIKSYLVKRLSLFKKPVFHRDSTLYKVTLNTFAVFLLNIERSI